MGKLVNLHDEIMKFVQLPKSQSYVRCKLIIIFFVCPCTGYVQKCYREGDKVVIVYCAEYNELSSKRKYRKK